MKKSRIFALLCALALLLSCGALAEEQTDRNDQLLTLILPDEVTMLPLETAVMQMTAPEGLEAMYAMMATANEAAQVYLAQPKNGRAVMSIANTEIGMELPAEFFAAQGQRICDTVFRDGANGAWEPISFYGHSGISLQGQFTCGGIPCNAQGFLFSVQTALVEIWTVSPNETAYLFNDEAEQQRMDDLASLTDLLSSISFPGDPETVLTPVDAGAEPNLATEIFRDYAARFTAELPAGTVVMDSLTSPDTVQKLRETYLAANVDGADVFFTLLEEFAQEGSFLYLLPDGQSVCEVYVGKNDFSDCLKPEDFAKHCEAFCANAQDRFGFAMTKECAGSVMIGKDRAYLCAFFVRCRDFSLIQDIILLPVGDTLMEVDLYTPVTGDMRQNLLWLLENRFSLDALYDGTER